MPAVSRKTINALKNGIFQLKNWKKHYVFCLKQELYQTHTIPTNYRRYAGKWECHIGGRNSDWLMVWEQNDTELTLLMLRTGSHADIY